jgi:chromosome segregation ATPase
MNQRRRVRQLEAGLAHVAHHLRETARDLEDVDSRLGLLEGTVEQLGTDVSNLEAEIND